MRPPRGYSLLEIVVVVFLMAMLAGMAMLKLNSTNSGADTRGLAGVVAEQLRAARAQAIAKRIPVAISFPSNLGTVPHSQSCYQSIGTTDPQITRSLDYSGDFPNAYIFIGAIGADSLLSNGPPATKADGHTFDRWNPIANQDYTFLFLPSGQVLTNDLPVTNGSHRIVVASSLSYAAAGLAPPAVPVSNPPNYFELQGVGKAYTISLSASGHISVEPGVVGTASTVALVETPPPPPAPSVAPNGPGGLDPVISSIRVFPDYSDPAFEGVVEQGDHTTLRVEATCDRGAEPMQLQVVPNGGALATDANDYHRMSWDPIDQVWVGQVDWAPPPNAVPGQDFELEIRVQDRFGRVTSSADTGTTPVVEHRTNEKFLICGFFINDILVSADGNRTERLPNPLPTPWRAGISHDGTMLAVGTQTGGDGVQDLFRNQLTSISYPTSIPTLGFGPGDSSLLVGDEGWGSSMYAMRLDGSEQRVLFDEGQSPYGIRVSPNGRWLAYGRGMGDGLYVRELDAPPGPISGWSVSSPTFVGWHYAWTAPAISVDSNYIFFEDGGGEIYYDSLPPSGSPVRLTDGTGTSRAVATSPTNPEVIAYVKSGKIRIESLSTGLINELDVNLGGTPERLEWIPSN